MSGSRSIHDDLLLVVGLTGVGKSTLVRRLVGERAYRLLPDRRELADRIAIPEAQTLLGEEVAPVADRIERFRLTARYRAENPGGLAHALVSYLAEAPHLGALVFESLRGAAEIHHALEWMPRARLVMLDAPAAVRVERLLARAAAFDWVEGADSSAETIAGLAAELSIDDATLGRLSARAERSGGDLTLARVLSIVAEEQRHYGDAECVQLLRALPHRARVIDAGARDAPAIAEEALAWI